jgi:hypothetical protein
VTSTTKTTNPFNESYYLNTADLVNDDNKTNNMTGNKAAYQDSWISFTVCRLLLWGRNNRNKVRMVFLGQIYLASHRTRISLTYSIYNSTEVAIGKIIEAS